MLPASVHSPLPVPFPSFRFRDCDSFRYVPEDTRQEPAGEIDAVSSVQLEILLGHVDQVLVLFSCDDTPDGLKSELALRALGAAKEHFESRGISVVKTHAVNQACILTVPKHVPTQGDENVIRIWFSSLAHVFATGWQTIAGILRVWCTDFLSK